MYFRSDQSSFEFKFDDTRLSSYYKNKIGPIDFFFYDFLQSLCCLSLVLSNKNRRV